MQTRDSHSNHNRHHRHSIFEVGSGMGLACGPHTDGRGTTNESDSARNFDKIVQAVTAFLCGCEAGRLCQGLLGTFKDESTQECKTNTSGQEARGKEAH